jgi:HD-GYP domain-containing protein (c-di-GMP phosphodiesterase class II)
MSDLILSHPVTTLDDRLLLPAGSQLSAEILDDLISRAGTVTYQQSPLIQYGSIKGDILNFITLPPYNVIFSEQRTIDDLLNLMENIHVISPVLQSLDYFKQNDFYTYRHILNVFALYALLTNVMKLSNWARLKEATTGPIHDFGKICVPLNILKKSSPLKREERSFLEHHSVAGYALLSYYLQNPRDILAVVARDHHEREDGSGYPRGIKLKDHTVEIIAVCDVYDALISPRPYRSDAYDNRTAIEEITEMGEKNVLNREVIKALVCVNRKLKNHYSKCIVSSEKRGKEPLNNNYGEFSDEEN